MVRHGQPGFFRNTSVVRNMVSNYFFFQPLSSIRNGTVFLFSVIKNADDPSGRCKKVIKEKKVYNGSTGNKEIRRGKDGELIDFLTIINHDHSCTER